MRSEESMDTSFALVVPPPHQRQSRDNAANGSESLLDQPLPPPPQAQQRPAQQQATTTQPQTASALPETHSDYVKVEDTTTPSSTSTRAQAAAVLARAGAWISSVFGRNDAASNNTEPAASALKVKALPKSQQQQQQDSNEQFRDEPDDYSGAASLDGNMSLTQRIASNPYLYGSIFGLMALGLLFGLYSNRYKLLDLDMRVDYNREIHVAFLGNAYLFVNDVPRLLQAISDEKVHQNSVLHNTAGSLPDLLMRGNGMYYAWQTETAIMDSVVDEDGYNVTIYDYGLCTVAQLLMGQDDILTYGNNDNAYYNDGLNPCIVDEVYMDYTYNQLYYAQESVDWDYIVLVDQTKRMAVQDARQESVYALTYAYAPLIQQTNAIPVIIDTHAFWSDNTNMTGLGGSVEYFQALIYDGVQDYVDALSQQLSEDQQPIVAPIGVAYLTIYQENYNQWQKLFLDDQMHASVHGTYLLATVLYATMYGHLPKKAVAVYDGLEPLFATARKLLASDTSGVNYPSEAEAFYYRNVARRVVLQGYVPNILLQQDVGANDDVDGDGDY